MIGNIMRLFPIFWNSWDFGAPIADADISTGFRVCVSGWNSWGNVIKKTTWRKKRENNEQKVKTTDPPFSVPSPSPTFWLPWSLPAISGWRTTTETELQNSASQLHITWHYNKTSQCWNIMYNYNKQRKILSETLNHKLMVNKKQSYVLQNNHFVWTA